MELWQVLIQVLVVLGAALALGMLFERLRQSAILGYLAAGVLLGPGGFNLVRSGPALAALSELGVALLLFSIGLEFSWSRLKRFGVVAFGGGVLQVTLTIAIAAGLLVAIGLAGSVALAVGAMVALSSTATVLRILTDRAELDAVHGRNAIGILLLQDIALVPLVLLVTILGGGESASPLLATARSIAVGGGFVLLAWLLLNSVLPHLLHRAAAAKNRELGILLAVVTCLGAALGAHALDLSPALGAFVAGMLLAESPFATQVRADVAGLRTLFLTIFFVAAGMLADLTWIASHFGRFLLVVSLVLVLKTLIIWGILRTLNVPTRYALATGICLAQVGEFSFVLAEIGRRGHLLGDDAFFLLTAATVGTLFATPYLVAAAPRLAAWRDRRSGKLAAPAEGEQPAARLNGHIIVVGYGPAGVGVAEAVLAAGLTPLVVDLNPRTVEATGRAGVQALVGDARQEDVLRHARIDTARAVVVTLPDYRAAELVLRLARVLNPATLLIARARYHIFAPSLAAAGAGAIVDEEHEVGRMLGHVTLKELGAARG